MLPFAKPYPPEQKHGFWGIPTSTIDWCEENYVVSPYVAEALNTVTNAGFIALATYAIVMCVRHKLEKRFILTACGFLLVGIGSWLFHMTLQYEYQLLDELPMLYATCIPFWSAFSEFKDKRGSFMVGTYLFITVGVLTCVYLWFQDPTIHQVVYAFLNVGIILRSVVLSRKFVTDPKSSRELNTIMILGVTTFLFGYLLWNLDVHFCDFVRSTRRDWGMPYGFILEGHGWWHLLTGLGVYFYLVYMESLRCWLTGKDKFYTLKWTYSLLPVLHLTDPKGLEEFNRNTKKNV